MTAPTRHPSAAPPLEPIPPPVHPALSPRSEPASATVCGDPEADGSRHQDWLQGDGVPAWLSSLILHTAAIILLALFSMAETEPQGISLESRSGDAMPAEPALEILPEPSLAVPDNALAAEESVATPIAVPEPPSPEPRSPLVAPSEPETDAMNLAAEMADVVGSARVIRLSGGGLGGRSPEGRTEFGRRFGATPESEEAVELALRWLANHQRNNGSWSFNLDGPPCNGRCENRRDNPDQLPTPPTAATGLALLAFLGAGYTHHSGPYTEEVRQGLYYLRERMQPATLGADLQMGSMYGHGIATLAIAEAASMTGDEELRLQAKDLTKFILAARHPTKGWGYTPGSPGDITLTGWQAMALFGAKRLKIVMPSDIFSSIKAYVDSLSPDDGVHFGYREPSESPTPTAIGLALELYLGRPPEHEQQRLGLEAMLAAGPKPNNVYHNYYATLALHHARHAKWDQWHVPLRQHLIETQSRQGHQTGSWHFPDHYGDVGGRLYTTAMCAMILEVYYRYLPLYADPGEFPL